MKKRFSPRRDYEWFKKNLKEGTLVRDDFVYTPNDRNNNEVRLFKKRGGETIDCCWSRDEDNWCESEYGGCATRNSDWYGLFDDGQEWCANIIRFVVGNYC